MAVETEKNPGLSHTTRNMIIGVITTVLVSGTVYLLGFNKKNSGPTKLEKEKATTEAWKTYVLVENSYTKSSAILLRDMLQQKSYKDLFTAIKKESDKFMTGMRRLIANDDVDKDMIALLRRRVDNEETSLPPTEKIYTGLDEVVARANSGSLSVQQATDTVQSRLTSFYEHSKGMMDRAVTEIEDLSKTLSDRYHQPFNINDFLIIQVYKYKKDLFSILKDEDKMAFTQEFLTGKWDAAGSAIILYADNKWSWSVPSDSSMAEGTWELKNGQLLLNVPKHPKTGEKGVWIFDLSDATESSFTMHLTIKPFTLYTLVKK